MNCFAIFLEFSITHWVGTKRNETIICIFSLSRPFPNNFYLERSHNCIFLIFCIFLQFFMSFLLPVGLKRSGMIIFIFPISRFIVTYYGLKWSHNGIFIFSEFFFYFLGIFFTHRVGTKRNDNFCFPSFSAFFNVFWLEMKPQWYFFKFFKIFPIFWNFLLRVRLEWNMTIVFPFSLSQRSPPLFWL